MGRSGPMARPTSPSSACRRAKPAHAPDVRTVDDQNATDAHVLPSSNELGSLVVSS